MNKWLLAAVLTCLCAAPVLAADAPADPKKPGPNFEQRKTEIITRIDARMAREQALKSCVQAAASFDAIEACREQNKPKKNMKKEGMPPQPGQAK